VTVGLVLLATAALAAASLTIWRSWLGQWRFVALALGVPFALAGVTAVLASGGALNDGSSEDWGPLFYLMVSAVVVWFVVVTGVISIVVGLFGYWSRKAQAAVAVTDVVASEEMKS
jgi:hypothetical protein